VWKKVTDGSTNTGADVCREKFVTRVIRKSINTVQKPAPLRPKAKCGKVKPLKRLGILSVNEFTSVFDDQSPRNNEQYKLDIIQALLIILNVTTAALSIFNAINIYLKKSEVYLTLYTL
jgi:hypothetical protein